MKIPTLLSCLGTIVFPVAISFLPLQAIAHGAAFDSSARLGHESGMMGDGYGPGMMRDGYGPGMMRDGYGTGMMGGGYGPGMMRDGYGPGMMGGGYGPGMMRDGYGPGDDDTSMLLNRLGWLGLSDAQRERIFSAQEEHLSTLNTLREQMLERRAAIDEALSENDPDVESVGERYSELLDVQRRLFESKLKRDSTIRDALDEKQRERLKRLF